MQTTDLLEVLHRINKKRPQPVDDEFLDQIMALVVMKPLNEDRQQCQEQIKEILKQRTGGH